MRDGASDQKFREPTGEQRVRDATGEQRLRDAAGDQRFREPTGEHRFRAPTGEQAREVTSRSDRPEKEVTTRATMDAKPLERTPREATAPDIVQDDATRRKERAKTRLATQPFEDEATEADDRYGGDDAPISDIMRITVAKTDRTPLFSRGDTVTLVIAAVMGALIMTVSYVYAANVPLPDDAAQIERVR